MFAFIINEILFEILNNFALSIRFSTINSSSMPLTDPIIVKWASLGKFGSLLIMLAQILSCDICYFSGLNCAKLTSKFYLGFIRLILSINFIVSQGGYLKNLLFYK